MLTAILVLSGTCLIAQGAKVALQPAAERTTSPELCLQDSVGQQVNLKEYRGKVVVLDFWATWCHGCREEMPWFAELRRKYGDESLSVVGVSLDDGGWKVVKQFIQTAAVPYRIVLGNDSIAKTYAISNGYLSCRPGRPDRRNLCRCG